MDIEKDQWHERVNDFGTKFELIQMYLKICPHLLKESLKQKTVVRRFYVTRLFKNILQILQEKTPLPESSFKNVLRSIIRYLLWHLQIFSEQVVYGGCFCTFEWFKNDIKIWKNPSWLFMGQLNHCCVRLGIFS